jgi:predicted outer membrane repeat protein
LPPAIPDGFTATASNRKIFLSWNQNRERDFYQYLVYGDTVPSPSTIVATITGISDTTVIISSLQNNDTYYYRLSAIDSSGLESEKTLDVYNVPRPQRYEVNQNQTGDFISIQSAINYTTEDDTLIIHNGTYSENIDLLGKALIIGSEYFTSGDSAHIASTVIDGQLNGSTITISDISGSEIKLVGFTIQNGSAYNGGAIYSSNSYTIFENLIIKNTPATTNVDEWINAEAGVGASIASGSHT